MCGLHDYIYTVGFKNNVNSQTNGEMNASDNKSDTSTEDCNANLAFTLVTLHQSPGTDTGKPFLMARVDAKFFFVNIYIYNMQCWIKRKGDLFLFLLRVKRISGALQI